MVWEAVGNISEHRGVVSDGGVVGVAQGSPGQAAGQLGWTQGLASRQPKQLTQGSSESSKGGWPRSAVHFPGGWDGTAAGAGDTAAANEVTRFHGCPPTLYEWLQTSKQLSFSSRPEKTARLLAGEGTRKRGVPVEPREQEHWCPKPSAGRLLARSAPLPVRDGHFWRLSTFQFYVLIGTGSKLQNRLTRIRVMLCPGRLFRAATPTLRLALSSRAVVAWGGVPPVRAMGLGMFAPGLSRFLLPEAGFASAANGLGTCL